MYNTADMAREVEAGERQQERTGGRGGERVGVRNHDLEAVSSANWAASAQLGRITGLVPFVLLLQVAAGLLAMSRIMPGFWATQGAVAIGLGVMMKWAMTGRRQCSRVNNLLDQAWKAGTPDAGASSSPR